MMVIDIICKVAAMLLAQSLRIQNVAGTRVVRTRHEIINVGGIHLVDEDLVQV